MGLEEFKQESEPEEPSLSTRKQVQNVTFDKESLANVFYGNPETLYTLASGTDENSTKALINLFTDVMNEDHEVGAVGKAQRDRMESVKENTVEDQL